MSASMRKRLEALEAQLEPTDSGPTWDSFFHRPSNRFVA